MTRPTTFLGMLIACLGCAHEPESETPQGTARNVARNSLSEPQDAAALPAAGDFDAPWPGAEEIRDGWISLFDGVSLFGWQANSDTNWRVEDGLIVADGETPGLLMTTSQFADFRFRCDFRLAAGGNSGVFLRSAFRPNSPVADCYELNICDSHAEYPTGSLVGRTRSKDEHRVESEWHTFHVNVAGQQVSVHLDGEPVLAWTDDVVRPRVTGFIGLQMNGGRIEFRRIALRPLSTQPLFRDEDLDGWREVPGSASRFDVVDGTIHVTNGLGFLETESSWQNFILQAQVRTNGVGLNSGIFFRAMPGTADAPSNGYEFQIHNGFNDGDPGKPVDQGTGAIFRRAPARRVVAKDHEWFTVTLIAQGPHMATWVDGYQVVDWIDERDPDENPRRGLRLAAGHFSLQGHDPTTDLNFRHLNVVETPLLSDAE